jgi:hypothetical protein
MDIAEVIKQAVLSPKFPSVPAEQNLFVCSLVAEKAADEERDRVHIEVNKLLEPLKLHLCWITGGETPSEDYGFADEDGDGVDVGIIYEALKEYEK